MNYSDASTNKLSPLAEKFVLHWGEMGTRWGVNRTIAQIHALLFFTGSPMAADDITNTLGVARSNVSNSLKELQNWGLIRVVHLMGDRRDHFESSSDVWGLFRTIVAQRKLREFDPTINLLREVVGDSTFLTEDKASQLRVKESLALMETLNSWTEEMLRLEPATLLKLLTMGAKVQSLIRGPSGAAI